MKKIGFTLFIIFCAFFTKSQTVQKDCPARTVCSNYGPTNKLNGIGSLQDINSTNQGCLSVEHNSDWIVVTITSNGTFEFTITPVSNGDDFDFAVWGPKPTCPPTTIPIRCSWAAYFGGGIQPTGVSSINNAPQTDFSEGSGGNNWVQTMNVLYGEQYIILIDDFTSNKKYSMTFGGTASMICEVLPIELSEFSGQPKQDKNVIQWKTQTETNNQYFSVEKSNDAYNFKEIYNIQGAGNSNQELQYEFIDSKEILGIKYYRLKQVDYNGNFSYSNIISIENNSKEIKLVKRINYMGVDITDFLEPKDFFIEIYSDGSVLKIVK